MVDIKKKQEELEMIGFAQATFNFFLTQGIYDISECIEKLRKLRQGIVLKYGLDTGAPLQKDILFRQPIGSVETKIPRNASCPCGSGKKYKKCCG